MSKGSFAHSKFVAALRASLFSGQLLLFLFLSGCVIKLAGADFARPDFRAYSIGNVTESAILRGYGEPFSRGRFTKNNEQIHTLHYYYATTEYGSRWIYKKHCWFYFAGEKFLGYSFSTGFRKEQVNFDERNLSRVIKGKTRRDEVIALFGYPSGSLRYPATPERTSEQGDSLVDYEFYVSSYDSSSFEDKDLRVIFDANGIVKDVHLDANKRNGPRSDGHSSPDP